MIRRSDCADAESGHTLITGLSQRHLEDKTALLRNLFGVQAAFGPAHVAYRETLRGPATVRFAHKKHVGPPYQFAVVTLAFEPLPSGSGIAFATVIGQPDITEEYVHAVEKGVRAQSVTGVLAGFPLTDFKATLVDARQHEVDSTPLAFEIAARGAIRELRDVAILLEPVVSLVVHTPDEFLGGVIGDINARRGSVVRNESAPDHMQMVIAEVPLANMDGYEDTLKSLCRGEARYWTEFERYQYVPDIPGDNDPKFPGAAAMRVA